MISHSFLENNICLIWELEFRGYLTILDIIGVRLDNGFQRKGRAV